MKKKILVGFGELGQGLFDVFSRYHRILIHDPLKGYLNGDKVDKINLLLVAIPFSEDFVKIVREYQERFKPDATVIFSTVPVGTTKQIPFAVHSPVEAPHPIMAQYIGRACRFVGGDFNQDVCDFFEFAGLEVRWIEKADFTEFLKLRSTTVYGLAIEFARYSAEVAEKIGMPYDVISEYDREYNHINRINGRQDFQRYVIRKPEGKIGGHCVLPNAKLLVNQFYHPFLDTILEINGEKWKEVSCIDCKKALDVIGGIVPNARNVFNLYTRASGYICDECSKRARELKAQSQKDKEV